MKNSKTIFLNAAICAATILGSSSIATAQNVSIPLKLTTANEPIVISSNGNKQATKVQALDVSELSGQLSEALVTLSDPKYLLGLQAKIGDVEVGRYDFDGIFNVDLNTPTMPTQIPIQIDSNLAAKALEKSKELSIWTIPSEHAAPNLKIKIGVKTATVSGQKVEINAEPVEYRFGVLVRDSGWDGIAKYRIPALARTNNGTLIAVYDARRQGFADLPADIDVACSRSVDDGKTWEPMNVIIDFKGDDEAKEGVGDPCILVDQTTGRIWVMALWAHNGKSLRASQPGLKLGASGQLVAVYSDDDGKTWSEPRNLTETISANRDWRILFQGPGNGITTRDGKLVLPVQYLDKDGQFFSALMYSADHGESWNVSNAAKKSTCEPQVVELNDGSLMLNMRNFGKDAVLARSIATSKDFGATWQEDVTSNSALPCPICQASIIRISSQKDGDSNNLLAFMNPNSTKGRVNLTLRLSEDEGKTWSRALNIYTPGGCGYSTLAKIDAQTIGVLHETNGGLVYQTVNVHDVK